MEKGRSFERPRESGFFKLVIFPDLAIYLLEGGCPDLQVELLESLKIQYVSLNIGSPPFVD